MIDSNKDEASIGFHDAANKPKHDPAASELNPDKQRETKDERRARHAKNMIDRLKKAIDNYNVDE